MENHTFLLIAKLCVVLFGAGKGIWTKNFKF